MKDPHIKGERLVYTDGDGSKVSIQGCQAWRHINGRTENIPIESLGVTQVHVSQGGGSGTRATLKHTDGSSTDVTLRSTGGPSIVRHRGADSIKEQ